MATPNPDRSQNEDVITTVDDEDTGAQIAPIIRLEEVAVTTGEEDEEILLDLKSKLYRFDKEGNQWKERGAGTVKLLKHKETKKVRLVMRQTKTLKICANHLVLPTTKLQEHVGNEKSCVWHAADFSDGELKEEMFCIRFVSIENCQKFKDKIEEIAESQQTIEHAESEEVSTATDLIEKLTVGESKSKEEPPVSDNDVKEENKVEEKAEK
ncbi:hypothetical protein ZOSMA_264G00260 [Zostera marina]|uniref:RanBD1 domain-containing protein n=1 Tax=Zostera marina TaxID=29655 RepID=A0A0K9PH53_ZOSMR|nr:hypothetical protein ZOSMA_264G00260 [Zostera marina]